MWFYHIILNVIHFDLYFSDGLYKCVRVLLCAAVCCCVLPCAAVCCRVLPCAAECCCALLCAAVCSRVLPCAAVCCCVLQCTAVCVLSMCVCVCVRVRVLQCTALSCCVQHAVCCSVLQCGLLQYIAVHCSAWQCATGHPSQEFAMTQDWQFFWKTNRGRKEAWFDCRSVSPWQ